MRALFATKPLVVAISALSLAGVASAAGLDRSGQDTTAFFQDGTYAEINYAYIDADVTGEDASGNKVEDIAEDYDFVRYAVKTDINDTVSVGVLFDEPWGAAADYVGDNNFIGQNNPNATVNYLSGGQFATVADAQAALSGLNTAIGNIAAGGGTPPQNLVDQARQVGGLLSAASIEASTVGEETNVEVRSQSLSGLLGVKLGQNKELQVYGGPVAQRLKADVHLRGKAYSSANGYDLAISPDMDYGWLAGLQYSKPEIALKASLTYRSEIDHEVEAKEYLPILAALQQNPRQNTNMTVTTPESVNFDFQTGVNPTTLATAKVRWVPWSDFAITPPAYNSASKSSSNPNGLNLVDYDEDQWLVELGLAKRLNPQLAVSGVVGWDSGAGNPVTSLGPVEGYYSVGVGAKYNVTENWAVSAGGKYLMFGDAEGKIPTGSIVSNFEDNDGYVVGLKLSYQEK